MSQTAMMPNPAVALVTGASRGIGRGIAVALAARGWAVVVNYRGNAEAARRRRWRRSNEAGGSRPARAGRHRATPAIASAWCSETLDRYGRIDLLVNNAGMAPRLRVDLLEMGEASYDEVMAINLKGPFFLTQRVASS